MFSVADEQEARELLVLCCETNNLGEYIARELAREQTLERLNEFGSRLRKMHDEVMIPRGLCRCKKV